MSEAELEQLQQRLTRAEVERDALRLELGELRARLCQVLGIIRAEPGPQGLTVLSVAPDHEILAAISRLLPPAAPISGSNDGGTRP